MSCTGERYLRQNQECAADEEMIFTAKSINTKGLFASCIEYI
jgi:hypothetical protein